MLRCHLKIWVEIGAAAILGWVLCCSLALADETQRAIPDSPFLQRPSSDPDDTGFFLKFSQRYYHAVETSLQENSFFAFRYYLVSPFDSFDKRQFISENPTQANDIALRALHNTFRQAVDEIELLEIIRDNIHALTSFKMVIGADGARLHGPSLTGLGLQNSVPQADPNRKMTLSGGLTFAEDFRLGLTLTMTYQRIISKLRYYPTSRNEVMYTAETQLTASTKVGLSYRQSHDGNAVLTTFSFVF
jgi:hypothetical protein